MLRAKHNARFCPISRNRAHPMPQDTGMAGAWCLVHREKGSCTRSLNQGFVTQRCTTAGRR